MLRSTMIVAAVAIAFAVLQTPVVDARRKAGECTPSDRL